MKDLIQNARAVEARLRENTEYCELLEVQAADTISSLITALEAAQKLHVAHAVTLKDQLEGALTAKEEAQKDTERLDYLETQCEAYGFEDEHLGNRWVLDGPFCSARKCIDAAIKAQGDAK